VDTRAYLPQPYITSKRVYAGVKYHLPDIGEVNGVTVEHIRTVAYVPTEEITEQNGYDKVAHEPNDIDLVTVEANFDVEGLMSVLPAKIFLRNGETRALRGLSLQQCSCKGGS
jgi:hypothetical protein